MTSINFAKRVYDHRFQLDPIIRSLFDTDVYKLLMLQTIWKEMPEVPVTFSLINRTGSVKLAEEIDESELRAQLDHARTVGMTKKEQIWLAGNTFYGQARLFEEDFISWLKDFRLPEYDLEVRDGQFEIRFSGAWSDVTLWEIPALAIISELRSRSAMKDIRLFEMDVLYARAKARLWEKVVRLQKLRDLKIADFGTRRRHSFLWQIWCVDALKEGLGSSFIGTSNVLLAMDHDLEAIGTNAHELPMVSAAMAGNDEELRQAPYRVLENWQKTYGGNLLIVLPDTFGSTAFLNDAPDWVADWSGFRVDSKDPIAGGEELIEWWQAKRCDPREKLVIFSDGLDIDTIESTYNHFEGRVRMSFGWGTNLTNDFRDCAPVHNEQLKAISLVCKLTEVDGKPAVKLSDNLAKALGPQSEIDRYLKVFGSQDLARLELAV